MFVVFLVGIMPKEYIHDALFHHEDDMHPIYKKGEVVITKKHNHCSFLSFEFAPFLVAEHQFIKFKETVCYTGYVLPVYTFHCTTSVNTLSLRGPPAAYTC